MISYGLACAFVLALSWFDRRSMPFALVLGAGWILGFLPAWTWPLISIASGTALIALMDHRSPLWAYVIVSCVPVMLLCDAMYFGLLHNGVYVGREYAGALNVLLAVQLAACGWPGGRRGVRSLVLWISRVDRGRMGRNAAADNQRKSA